VARGVHRLLDVDRSGHGSATTLGRFASGEKSRLRHADECALRGAARGGGAGGSPARPAAAGPGTAARAAARPPVHASRSSRAPPSTPAGGRRRKRARPRPSGQASSPSHLDRNPRRRLGTAARGHHRGSVAAAPAQATVRRSELSGERRRPSFEGGGGTAGAGRALAGASEPGPGGRRAVGSPGAQRCQAALDPRDTGPARQPGAVEDGSHGHGGPCPSGRARTRGRGERGRVDARRRMYGRRPGQGDAKCE